MKARRSAIERKRSFIIRGYQSQDKKQLFKLKMSSANYAFRIFSFHSAAMNIHNVIYKNTKMTEVYPSITFRRSSFIRQ